MDINSSGTGGAEDINNLKLRKDESEVGDDANHTSSRADSRTSQTKASLKVGINSSVTSGNGDTAGLKNAGDDTAQGTPTKDQSDKLSASGKDTDENGKRIRYDSYGNRITTTIGTFSVANRKNLIKNRKSAMNATSDTGGAETPLKKEEKK